MARLKLLLAALAFALPVAAADEPWIILGDELITEPTEIGDVILLGEASLTVTGVPEPGLRVSGNIWAVGSSEVVFEDSAIRFMSKFHGQYALVAGENARIEIDGCDYRIPNFVQHGLVVAGQGELVVRDTDFDDAQLITVETASITAERLNGNFEVIVQHDSRMTLADIPRDPGAGSIWVWVEFREGSEAVYTPPMPGMVDHWSFPPQDATGILQTVTVDRCEARLWPMLIREGSRVTLRDIPEDNWTVVGLHLFESTVVSDLINGTMYADRRLQIGAHDIHLVNASIDTWNLYPQGSALVQVRDSVLGEILAMGHPRVLVTDTTIDGSGGFFGARDHSHITAVNTTITCTVEATQDAVIELHHSFAEPYPHDPTGDFTRFGSYDRALLYAHHTVINSTPALDGDGLLAGSFVAVPAQPPGDGSSVPLNGTLAMFSFDGDPALAEWRVEAVSRIAGQSELIASGSGNAEDAFLGTWHRADPPVDQEIRVVLTDTRGRRVVGRYSVPVAGPRSRAGAARSP
jgi:hypothetical protein